MLPKLMLLPLITLGGFCATYFVNIVVPLRKPLQYSLLVIVLPDLLWLVNNCLLPEPSPFLNVVISPLIFLLLLFYTEPSQRYRGFLTQAVLAVLPILIVYVLASLMLPWALKFSIRLQSWDREISVPTMKTESLRRFWS